MKRSDGGPAPSGTGKGMVPDFDMTKLMAGGERGLKAMAEAQEHAIARLARVNREMAEFVDRRLSHDRETVRDLAACTTPQEAMSVWAKFTEQIARDYMKEAETFASLGANAAREAMSDAETGAEAARSQASAKSVSDA
jgi:hypothetical protein